MARRVAMTNDLQPEAELEIAHVLFIDVVGYSSRLIDEQTSVVAELNRVVRETSRFKSAEAGGRQIGRASWRERV